MTPHAPNRAETAQKAVPRWFTWCAVSFMTLGGYIFLSAMYWNPPSTPTRTIDAYLMIALSAILAGACWLLAWMCRTNRITVTWADDEEDDDA